MNSKQTWAAAAALAFALGGFMSLPSVAGEYDTTDFGERTPTAEELITSLTPAPRTRGISLEPVQPKAVSMGIRFEFDSARLTREARAQLTPLAQAITSPDLASERFVVEGHTDAVGSDEYNQWLSEQRAEAVKEFLVGEYQVDPNRIVTIGKGEAQLLNPDDPDSGANRRVQIVTQQ